jgi:hypothetical protein
MPGHPTDARATLRAERSRWPRRIGRYHGALEFEQGVKNPDPTYDFKTDIDIPKLAHDFVFPSAYQLMEANAATKTFLGNWVNPNASHLSGRIPRKMARRAKTTSSTCSNRSVAARGGPRDLEAFIVARLSAVVRPSRG